MVDRDGGDRAFARALAILGRRDHFRAELGEKLLGQGFGPAESDGAVARCVAEGWVDDRRQGERFARWRARERGWGPRRLHAELLRRGVADSDARAALAEVDEEEWARALAVALERAARQARPGWWGSGEGRARMVSSLLRRGFEPDDARQAVDRRAAVEAVRDDSDA